MQHFIEREERILEQELAEGRMDQAQYQSALKELYRDAQSHMEQEAQEAYDNSMRENGAW